MQPSPQALYSVAQVREAERIAIEDLQMPGLQLMRSAGLAAFNALKQRWPKVRRINVFCGGGNNAGDGYVLAKLALEARFIVCVYPISDPEDLTGDAQTAYRDFLQAGGKLTMFDRYAKVDGIIVDALLGTGLNRRVGDDYAEAIGFINLAGRPVLAMDVPSGLHADTGCVLGDAVCADITVTFIAPKTGLYTGEAAAHCGEIVCSSLNVPDSVLSKLTVAARILTKSPMAPRSRSAHKGHFGHVLLVGGNLGYSGAIRLAGEAALRCGAGLVSIATRTAHSAHLNMGRPELMCHGIESLEQLMPLLEKATTIVIGPGLGRDEWAQALLPEVLATDKTCVVDADALNLLAKNPFKRGNWVLTPHPGEAARLLNCSNKDISTNRFLAAKQLLERFGGLCVLKGAGTLVADSDGVFVATTGNPGMAGGGMGDVLSGMIAALAAQGLSVSAAAKLAVYVHGEAADLVAAETGERGLLASDLLLKIKELLN